MSTPCKMKLFIVQIMAGIAEREMERKEMDKGLEGAGCNLKLEW